MLVVADNLQGTRPRIREAVQRRDPRPVVDLVRRMVLAGARMIDINPGPTGRDAGERMAFLVDAVRSASQVPLLIDTADPEAMEAGLEVGGAGTILNGFSLEPRKLEGILPLAVRSGAGVIGYLVDERSQPPASAEERLGIAVELDRAARSKGVATDRLILDPFVAPLIWEDGPRRNREALEVVRQLPEVLGRPVRTVAALSNLTSGGGADAERRRRTERAFLPMLAAAGLDMVLLDVFHGEAVALARTCVTLLAPHVFTWETL